MGDELVRGSEFTTPTKYDPKVKERAYELYLTTDLSLTDIAIDIGVHQKVVAAWANSGNWRARKAEIDQEGMARAEDKYRQLIVQQRGPTVERHLRISKLLEETIEKVLEEATKDDGLPSDMKLKRLAEALSSATGISARAAGINDKPFGDGGSGKAEPAKRAPLVIIGLRAQAAPGKEGDGPPIDVEVR